MAFEIVLTERAHVKLLSFPTQQQEFIRRAILDDLAGSPARVSRPSRPPAELPGFQVFHIKHEPGEGSRTDFKIFFKYGADEETLYIYTIGSISYRAR